MLLGDLPLGRIGVGCHHAADAAVTARGERVRAGDRVIEVAVVRMTPKGREAIGASALHET